MSACSISRPTLNTPNRIKKVYPKSISLSTMLRLGNVISSKIDPPHNVDFHEFDVDTMAWKPAEKKKLYIESEPFAKGGFRAAYKAKDIFNTDKIYVIKKFLPDSFKAMEGINAVVSKEENEESLARKAVQMHMLAKNLADSLEKVVVNCGVVKEFGETFSYYKVYFGIILGEQEQYIVIEDYIDGEFKKYINNNGVSHTDGVDTSLVEKAECLTHFSYVKSDQHLMLVDIQGSQFKLYDPEIATVITPIDENGTLKFCLGNLSQVACDNFIGMHFCNKFCKLIGLKPF